jgi:hypothetical protein
VDAGKGPDSEMLVVVDGSNSVSESRSADAEGAASISVKQKGDAIHACSSSANSLFVGMMVDEQVENAASVKRRCTTPHPPRPLYCLHLTIYNHYSTQHFNHSHLDHHEDPLHPDPISCPTPASNTGCPGRHGSGSLKLLLLPAKQVGLALPQSKGSNSSIWYRKRKREWALVEGSRERGRMKTDNDQGVVCAASLPNTSASSNN